MTVSQLYIYIYVHATLCTGGCSSNGLSAEELAASLATVHSLAVASGAAMKVLRQRPAELGDTVECLVRRRVEENDFLEVR
jgi:GTPase